MCLWALHLCTSLPQMCIKNRVWTSSENHKKTGDGAFWGLKLSCLPRVRQRVKRQVLVYTLGVNHWSLSKKWTRKVLMSRWKWREAVCPKQIPNPWNITSQMNDGISPVSSISTLACLALVTAVGTRGPWNTLLPHTHSCTHTHAHLHTWLANDRLSNQHSLLINYITVCIHSLSLPHTQRDTDVSSPWHQLCSPLCGDHDIYKGGGMAGACACVSGRRGLGGVVAGDDGPGKKRLFLGFTWGWGGAKGKGWGQAFVSSEFGEGDKSTDRVGSFFKNRYGLYAHLFWSPLVHLAAAAGRNAERFVGGQP